MKRLSLPVLLAILVAATGCASIEKFMAPGTPGAALTNDGIEIATVRVVSKSSDPVAEAARARACLTDFEKALGDGSLLNGSLDGIDAAAQKVLAARVPDPLVRAEYNLVRQSIHDQLAASIQSTTAPLRPQDVAAIRQAIADVRNGLTLAGY